MASNVPYFYEQINGCTSPITPSVMHTGGNALSYFFRKYLFLEASSIFKVTIPETWPLNRLQALVFGIGYASVFNTDQYGIVYDRTSLTGQNVFYNPTHATLANPCIKANGLMQIGVDCEIIQLRPDYQGIRDICAYYGDMMALCSQALQSNLINARLAYVFAASNKAGAESFKKMFDGILQGDPAVFVDSTLAQTLDKSKGTGWQAFDANLKQNFIALDLQTELRRIKAQFDTEVGIPNANVDKKERMLADEVNSNNVETSAKATLWLTYLQRSCEKVHKLFGLTKSDLWFDWQFPQDDPDQNPQTEEVSD